MAEMDTRELLHRIKSPVTLLEVYFSALEEMAGAEEILIHVRKYAAPCKSAVKEISRIVEALSGNE